MEELPVILVFVLCLILLVGAYLLTVLRCSTCCWKGIQITKEEKHTELDADDAPTFTIVVDDPDPAIPSESNSNHFTVKSVPEIPDST